MATEGVGWVGGGQASAQWWWCWTLDHALNLPSRPSSKWPPICGAGTGRRGNTVNPTVAISIFLKLLEFLEITVCGAAARRGAAGTRNEAAKSNPRAHTLRPGMTGPPLGPKADPVPDRKSFPRVSL